MVSNRVGKLKFRQVKIRLFRKGIRKWRCKSFVRLFRKGSFCPVCLKVYRIEEDHVNPMVMCDRCDRWIHTGLSVISNIFCFPFFFSKATFPERYVPNDFYPFQIVMGSTKIDTTNYRRIKERPIPVFYVVARKKNGWTAFIRKTVDVIANLHPLCLCFSCFLFMSLSLTYVNTGIKTHACIVLKSCY